MKIKQLAVGGSSIAIIFILSAFISFPAGNFGYLNIGDAFIMLFASILDTSLLAFLVSGIGSMMADIYLGYSQYAIFTFLIKGMEGWIVHKLVKKNHFLAYLCGGIIVVAGYALTDVILTSQWMMAFESIAFNSIQVIVSIIIAICLHQPFMKIKNKIM